MLRFQAFLDKSGRYDRNRRLRNLRKDSNWLEAAPTPPKKANPTMLEKQFVVTVRMYRPASTVGPQPSQSQRSVNPNTMKYNQEFLALGSTPVKRKKQ